VAPFKSTPRARQCGIPSLAAHWLSSVPIAVKYCCSWEATTLASSLEIGASFPVPVAGADVPDGAGADTVVAERAGRAKAKRAMAPVIFVNCILKVERRYFLNWLKVIGEVKVEME
jgi:hypothetical protein